MTFEEAWAKKEAEGYQYGRDALEQVHFGWKIREGYAVTDQRRLEAMRKALQQILEETTPRDMFDCAKEALEEDDRIRGK